MKPIVLAMTGASGSVYGTRLLEVLLKSGCEVDLVVSPAATQVIQAELGVDLDPHEPDVSLLLADSTFSAADLSKNLRCHDPRAYSAGIASGSFQTEGMVICPCSMGTLASLANGLSSNLIHRAGHVHLKERRKLIVVPRETPLGSIQLSNMKTLADAGAIVLPAMPGFYHQPQSIADLVDFIVARICDQLGIDNELMHRWGGE